MGTGIKDFFRRVFEPKALVLMYHRVAEPEYDTWEIAVSPRNFEAHLQVLQGLGNVIPLEELVQNLKRGKIIKNCIGITFDDGYADNYEVAKPLLEKYNLPATFFIASGNIGKSKEFWWDELEHFVLFTPTLPAQLEITIAGKQIQYNLGQESELSEDLKRQHQQWKATVMPPFSARARLYYLLWEHTKPLRYAEQQDVLQRLRQWAGVPPAPRQTYLAMSEAQLQEIGRSSVITVGAHTVTHPALATHDTAYQQQELLQCRQYLEEQTNKHVGLLAYPYGNYNQDTLAEARSNDFSAAFTTEEQYITKRSDLHQLSRFQVKNLQADQFRQQLKQWINNGRG